MGIVLFARIVNEAALTAQLAANYLKAAANLAQLGPPLKRLI